MNNEEEICTGVVILGRVANKEAKKIDSNELLGTTIDVKMKSKIVSSKENNGETTIYYSENPDATRDLLDGKNNWKRDIKDVSNVKSYLIVVKNNEMKKGETLKFSYEYELPEKIEYENSVYGTFAVYYNQHTKQGVLSGRSIADKVGLVTGSGPIIEAELTSSVQEDLILREGQKITYTLKVTNKGQLAAKDVEIKLPVPSRTLRTDDVQEDKIVNVELIQPDETLTIELEVEVGTIRASTTYEDTEDFIEIKNQAIVTGKNIPDVTSNEVVNKAKKTEVEVSFDSFQTEDRDLEENEKFEYVLTIRNLKGEDIKNCIVDIKLNKSISIEEILAVKRKYIGGSKNSEGYVMNAQESLETLENTNSYNEETETLTMNIGDLTSEYTYYIKLIVKTKTLENDCFEKVLESNTTIKAENIETYKTESVTNIVSRPNIIVEQKSSKDALYIKEGEEIEYYITIKNDGNQPANGLQIIDNIPNELRVIEVSYSKDEIDASFPSSNNIKFDLGIKAKETVEIVIKVKGRKLDTNIDEKEIINYLEVLTANGQTFKTNEIKYIIEKDPNYIEIEEEYFEENSNENNNNENNNNEDNQNNNQNPEKVKYKISGCVWVDENQDGKKDSSEERLANVSVKLLDENANTIKETITSSNGDYIFSDLDNGNYYVVCEYDERLYCVTEYNKEGVSKTENSDFISANNVAVTGQLTINNSSIGNIDLGLTNLKKFDLKLDKYVSRITVQSGKGVETFDVKNKKLGKVDIHSKYIKGSTVLIEYTFVITNEGDTPGRVNTIVDYLPSDVSINSNFNPEWYSGTDGNIYTNVLSDVQINPGESKEVTLIVTKQMTGENTGILSNSAEIAESYGINGNKDYDSIAGNKNQKEDDYSSADVLITVKTGKIYRNMSFISLIFAVLIIVRIVINKRREVFWK